MSTLPWVPSGAGPRYILRAFTPLGVIELRPDPLTWSLFLITPVAGSNHRRRRDIGTLVYDPNTATWGTLLLADQTFHDDGYVAPGGGTRVPFDGTIQTSGLPSWQAAVDHLLKQADEVAAQVEILALPSDDVAALLADDPKVPVLERLRWKHDPEGAAATYHQPTGTAEIGAERYAPTHNPDIPPPAMSAADLAGLIRRAGVTKVAEAAGGDMATALPERLFNGWDLSGWSLGHVPGAFLFLPTNADPALPRVLWLNESEDNREQWDEMVKDQAYKHILIFGKQSAGAGEDIPF